MNETMPDWSSQSGILYGSLGLQEISGIDFSPQDIDVLVPLEFITEKWDALKNAVESMGYELFDLHEHDFRRSGIKTAFADEQDLSTFAGVEYTALKVVEFGETKYRQLTLKNYLRVYSKCLHDGYRRTKNNNKDVRKLNRSNVCWSRERKVMQSTVSMGDRPVFAG